MLGHSQAVRHRVLIPRSLVRSQVPQPIILRQSSIIPRGILNQDTLDPRQTRQASLCLMKESSVHAGQVDNLIRLSFPTEINMRPVYKFRHESARIDPLCKIAIDSLGRVQGCIRFFRCSISKHDRIVGEAIILGPLSIAAQHRGKGLAHQLIQHSLAEARARDLGPCFVVGDPKIYRKHGFCNATNLQITLDDQDNFRRFLVAELKIGQFTSEMKQSTIKPWG